MEVKNLIDEEKNFAAVALLCLSVNEKQWFSRKWGEDLLHIQELRRFGEKMLFSSINRINAMNDHTDYEIYSWWFKSK